MSPRAPTPPEPGVPPAGPARAAAAALALLAPWLLAAAALGLATARWRAAQHGYGAGGQDHLAAELVRAETWRNLGIVALVGAPLAAVAFLLGLRGAVPRGFRALARAALLATAIPILLQPDWRVVRVRDGRELPNALWRVVSLEGGEVEVLWGSSTVWAAAGVLAAAAALLLLGLRRGRQASARAWPSPRETRLAAFALALAAAAAGHAAWRAERTRPDVAGRANLLYVTWDSTRADRLSCYGHDRPTTPRLDRLAERSILCERAYSQYDWTRPSYASIVTSRPVEAMEGGELGPAELTLAEILADAGYRTRAVVQNPNLSAFFHQDQGFERYVELHPTAPVDAVAAQAERALEELAGGSRPFFLFVHVEQPHWPYESDGPFTEAFRDPDLPAVDPELIQAVMRHEYEGWDPHDPLNGARLEAMLALYDADVRDADRALGRILDRLAELGADADTAIAFNSDHGDEFFERGAFGHATGNLHQELTRVPLLFRPPPRDGVAPRRIAAPVANLDLVPTALGMLGIAAPEGLHGVDLLAEGREPRPVLSHAPGRLAVRAGELGLLLDLEGGGAPLLYDLVGDLAERSPLGPAAAAGRAALLEAAAARWLGETAGRGAAPGEGSARTMDAELERSLRDLGYL